MHVRDAAGNPTQDKTVFRQTIGLLEERCNLIVQTSTGGASWMTAEERLQPVELRPEMATLTTGTVNFGAEIFANPQPMVEQFARVFVANGVKAEIEVFETGMINNALSLVKKGIFGLPLHFDFVMGVPGGIPGEPATSFPPGFLPATGAAPGAWPASAVANCRWRLWRSCWAGMSG